MSVRRLNAKWVGLLSMLAGTGAGGCALIVGADGYSTDNNKTNTSTGTNTTGSPTGSGGTGGSGGSASGGAGPSGGSAGTGGGTPDGGGGKAGSGGGTPPGDAGRDAPPRGAGETTCMGNTCPSGQTCFMTAFSPPGLCSYSCETTPCDAEHDCVHSNRPADNFPFMCVKKCPAGVTCPTGLLCVPISSGPVCLPTGWFDGLGIGDDCFADEQCLSGTCRKPGGWCSKPCGAADPLCAHDPVTFENRNNEFNWCVSTAGALTCVPGCDSFGVTTCALYPGTTCRAVTDIGGSMQLACLP